MSGSAPRGLRFALCALLCSQLGCALVASKMIGTNATTAHVARPLEPDAKLRCDGAPCTQAGFTSETTRPRNPYVLFGTALLEGVAGAVLIGTSGSNRDGVTAVALGGGILLILASVAEAALGYGNVSFRETTDCCAFDQQTVASLRGERLLLASVDVASPTGAVGPTFSVAEALARRKANPKGFPAPPPDLTEAQGRLKGSSKVAVLEFKSEARELRKEDIRFYSDVVRGVALKVQPGLDVITRQNLLALLQAAGKDAADCEGTCQVDTGRKIGADAVISGELSRVGKLYKLSLLLHDTSSGNLIGSTVASGATLAELEASVGQASLELLTRP